MNNVTRVSSTGRNLVNFGRGNTINIFTQNFQIVPWYEQTFQYQTTTELLTTASANNVNRWRANSTNDFGGGYATDIQLDSTVTYGGNNSMRLDFPDANPFPAFDQENINAGRDLFTGDADFRALRHIWIEIPFRYTNNYTSIPNSAWTGALSTDEKTLLLFTQGGSRWEVKIGFGIAPNGTDSTVRLGDPIGGQSLLPNLSTYPAPAVTANTYWTAQWFRVRVEVSTGANSGCVFRVWMENPNSPNTFTLIHENTNVGDLGAQNFNFDTLRIGARPKNAGANGAMSMWVGSFRIYDTNPNWV